MLVHLPQRMAPQHPHHDRRREGVAGPNCVDHVNGRSPGLLRYPVRRAQQAAARPAREGNQMETVAVHQAAEQRHAVSGKLQQTGNHRQLLVVQLEDRAPIQHVFHDRPAVIRLPQVDVEHPEAVRAGGIEKTPDRGARHGRTLAQGTETDGVGVPGQTEQAGRLRMKSQATFVWITYVGFPAESSSTVTVPVG